MLKILVIGTGYVGLVSGTCFAEMGHQVTCIDKDKNKIEGLTLGYKIPIYEKNLDVLIKNNQKAKRLHFDIEMENHINNSDVVIIAVGTPLNKEGKTNFDYINQCVADIIKYAKKDLHVIMKSTVPVGTCDRIQKEFDQKSKFALHVVSNPEFLREGEAVNDFLFPDRIIIGSNLKDDQVMKKLYKGLEDKGVEILYTNRVTAELIKYASNSFLAAKVAFINEMADLSEKLGGDIDKISYGMGLDKRIGRNFLNAGPGFGGSCFPKDIKALINISEDYQLQLPLLKSVDSSNQLRYRNIVKAVEKIITTGSKIAVLGLTYKAGTDDTRCSPAISIIKLLCERGFKVNAHDPKGISKAKEDLEDSIIFYDDMYQAVENTDLCLVLTEWKEYKSIDAKKLASLMRQKNIYDLRKVIQKEDFLNAGFKIKVVGYKSE
jgi:UDPglucose 6-dehydrogenase